MRILIVDDFSETCDLLSAALALEGHEVDCALCGKEALDLVKASNYDVFLIDIALPDMDGYALARRIRQLHLFQPRPRLIAISGSPHDPSHPHATEAAFQAYLLKPVALSSLLRAIVTGAMC